jgi:2-polyprenyl-6-methoxyphenol hydroxylase-like FAD-dependent oxidoreductase
MVEEEAMGRRTERVRVETDRLRIEGDLILAADGYRSRVSDVLNAPEREFITLTDATVATLDGGPVELHPFLSVARRHIVFAVAAGAGASSAAAE